MWRAIRDFLFAVGDFVFGGDPKPPAPVPAPTPNPAPPVDDVEGRLLDAHNRQRRLRGLSGLTASKALARAAQAHAAWMARNRAMSHGETTGSPGYTGQTFSDRIFAAGYRASEGGENIAAGQAGVDEVMADWMASPDHRDNVLGPSHRNAGFGVATDAYGHVYWVAVFAAPLGPRLLRTLYRRRYAVRVRLPPAVVRRPQK